MQALGSFAANSGLYGLPVTTVSAMMGHTNPSFTLACYGRDPRDEQAIVEDVLQRAAAQIGG